MLRYKGFFGQYPSINYLELVDYPLTQQNLWLIAQCLFWKDADKAKHFDYYLPVKYIKTSQISWIFQELFTSPTWSNGSYFMTACGKCQLEGSRISCYQTDKTHLQSTNFFILNYNYPFDNPPCYKRTDISCSKMWLGSYVWPT